MNTKLIVEYIQHMIRSYRDPEEYGSWGAEYESYIYRARINVGQDQCSYNYERFDIGQEVKPGEVVYVLYMIYSDGDSFGRARGKIEVLWVFKDASAAFEAKKNVEKYKKEYSIKIKTEVGTEITLSNPGSGYFERVDSVDIKTLIVEA